MIDKENFTIVFIGAGNLATNLARALTDEGFRIDQVYSRTEKSACALAKLLSCDFTTETDQIRSRADLYLVALTDSALIGLLPQLVKGRESSLFVHTAGSVSMNIWEKYIPRYGVFYPLQTFSKQREVDFTEIPVFLEYANPKDGDLLTLVASSVSRTVLYATSEQRCYLHLAAVFACNFTNQMYVLADKIVQGSDFPFKVLLPLIDETARKVHYLDPCEAQTGPAVRYDMNVINKHLDLLKDTPTMKELYEKISESIHETTKNRK